MKLRQDAGPIANKFFYITNDGSYTNLHPIMGYVVSNVSAGYYLGGPYTWGPSYT
jgi:hypothetical protein